MFSKMRHARADLATMTALFPAAERIARDDGIEQPGAEHLLLASLDMDDDIAISALRAFDVDQAEIRAAIVAQHEEALRAIEVIADDNAISAALPASGRPTGVYRAQGSLQTAFRQAASLAKRDKATLNSGYFLLAITEAESGTVVRALQHLGIDPILLRDHTRRLLARRQLTSARTVDVDEPDEQPGQERSGWNANTMADFPVGPDDAGNAVMHGIGFLVNGWRRLRRR